MKNALTIAVCSLLFSGCGLTLGPQVETRYVLVAAGNPVIILANKSLPCRLLTDIDGEAVNQDVGGWVAMPPAHWETVKANIAKLKENQK